MPSCGVRPCVCLSVTFVHSVKTKKDIFEIFSPSGSHTILVFPHQTRWRHSDGNPPIGSVECRWGWQKSRFWAYVWLHCPAAGPAASYWQHPACCNRSSVVNTTSPDHRIYARKLWHLSLVVSGGVDSRRDEEMFMTRSLNVKPKTTEQRI